MHCLCLSTLISAFNCYCAISQKFWMISLEFWFLFLFVLIACVLWRRSMYRIRLDSLFPFGKSFLPIWNRFDCSLHPDKMYGTIKLENGITKTPCYIERNDSSRNWIVLCMNCSESIENLAMQPYQLIFMKTRLQCILQS